MNIARLFTHTVSVQTYEGGDDTGDMFASPVDKACFISDARRLVRDSSGLEVVSSTTLYGPLGDIDAYTPGSKVTVNGRTARVIGVDRRNSAGPPSAYHCQISLT